MLSCFTEENKCKVKWWDYRCAIVNISQILGSFSTGATELLPMTGLQNFTSLDIGYECNLRNTCWRLIQLQVDKYFEAVKCNNFFCHIVCIDRYLDTTSITCLAISTSAIFSQNQHYKVVFVTLFPSGPFITRCATSIRLHKALSQNTK